MAHNIPPPEPLDLTERVAKNNWKVWKKAWSNFEIATAVVKKPEPVRIATLLAFTQRSKQSLRSLLVGILVPHQNRKCFAEVQRILRAKTQCDL